MAIKISEMDALIAALDGTELVELSVGGVTYKGTLAELKDYTSLVGIRTETASYSADIGDDYVRMNVGSANDFTVPTNASKPFRIGKTLTVRQIGAGQTTVVASGGVTITTPETLLLRAQHSSVSLVKVGTDAWELTGDLELL